MVTKMKCLYEILTKKILLSLKRLFKVKREEKKSEYGKLKITDLLKDYPPASAIFKPAGVGVKIMSRVISIMI